MEKVNQVAPFPSLVGLLLFAVCLTIDKKWFLNTSWRMFLGVPIVVLQPVACRTFALGSPLNHVQVCKGFEEDIEWSETTRIELSLLSRIVALRSPRAG